MSDTRTTRSRFLIEETKRELAQVARGIEQAKATIERSLTLLRKFEQEREAFKKLYRE